MSEPRTALIVGAGIGGLAAGVALRRAGWRVRVFERAPHPRELGFALVFAPNAVAALKELGLAEAIAAEGVAMTLFEVRRADGATLRRIRFPESHRPLGQGALVALRPVLHGALLSALGPEALTLNQEGVGVETRNGAAILTLLDGSTAGGDVVIGADGAHSAIRRALHPDEPPPQRSGYFGLRGVAYDAAEALGDLTAVGYFGDGIEAGVARASHRAVYWYMSLLASHVPDPRADPRDILGRCTAGFDPRFLAITQATKLEDLRLDELLDRDPLDRWGSGAVTLLGDAAHPMLPHAGQGAAQALEDAVALGRELAADDTIAALRRYEQQRSARSRRIVYRARRIAGVTTTGNPLVSWVRNTAVRLVPASVLVNASKLEPAPPPPSTAR